MSDKAAQRISDLLDVAIQAARTDDLQLAEMAVKSALDAARKLPQRVIYLPDLTKEKSNGC